MWAEDRKKEIVNACLYSDARAVCQTSLIHLFIILYEFSCCRNWCICFVLETIVHTLIVTRRESFLWNLSGEESVSGVGFISLSLDVTAYTSVLLGLRVMDSWERGKIDSGSLPCGHTWKISALWISLRHSCNLV